VIGKEGARTIFFGKGEKRGGGVILRNLAPRKERKKKKGKSVSGEREGGGKVALFNEGTREWHARRKETNRELRRGGWAKKTTRLKILPWAEHAKKGGGKMKRSRIGVDKVAEKEEEKRAPNFHRKPNVGKKGQWGGGGGKGELAPNLLAKIKKGGGKGRPIAFRVAEVGKRREGIPTVQNQVPGRKRGGDESVLIISL